MSKDIEALIERLEKATGPESELDALLHAFSDGRTVREQQHPQFGRQLLARNSRPPHDEYWLDHPATVYPAVTSSMDAALALCERMLPGWSIRMSLSEGYRHPNVGMGRSYPTNKSVAFDHHTMPLAILLALFTALNQEESRSEESKNG